MGTEDIPKEVTSFTIDMSVQDTPSKLKILTGNLFTDMGEGIWTLLNPDKLPDQVFFSWNNWKFVIVFIILLQNWIVPWIILSIIAFMMRTNNSNKLSFGKNKSPNQPKYNFFQFFYVFYSCGKIWY